MITNDSITAVRDRVTRIFQFVQALHTLRNPISRHVRELEWNLSLQDLPRHPCLTLTPPTAPRSGDTDGDDDTLPAPPLLRVARPVVRPIPPPPNELAGWVQDGWQRHDQDATPVASRSVSSQPGPHVEAFEDDPVRVKCFEQWSFERQVFIETEQPAIRTHAIFEKLYQMRASLERDAERFEIILGDGILSWSVPGGSIRFPLVLQRLELSFDPAVPAFTLHDTPAATEFNAALLRSVPSVDGAVIGVMSSELGTQGLHPLMGEALTAFLNSVPPRLAVDGRFENDPPATDPPNPVVYRAPIVFLRKRTFGFTTALENIILDLQQSSEIPQSLQNIVGLGTLAPTEPQLEGTPVGTQSYDSAGDVLFTLEANDEQVRIAQTLAQHSCVLVQGPPGTGKTHTIANITGHLLAQGKRILITSSTTKALRVLRDKVARQLQPLCVSVLESDAQSNDQLKSSVDAIVDRLSRADEGALAEAARVLEIERASALNEMQAARQVFLTARHRESQPLVVAGDQYAPIAAAKIVFDGQQPDAWIPSPVTSGAALPITPEDVRALYRTNQTVPPSVEKELAQLLPDPAGLSSPQAFAQLAAELESLEKQGCSHRYYWKDTGVDSVTIEALIAGLPTVLALWYQAENWLYVVGADGFRTPGHRDVWLSLFQQIDAVTALAETARESIVRLGPVLASDIGLEEQIALLDEIVSYLEAGHNLTTFDALVHGKALQFPKWKWITSRVAVKGRPPKTLEEYRALQALAKLERERGALRDRWERQIGAIGGPALPAASPEDTAAAISRAMRAALKWYREIYTPYHDNLVRAGFLWAEVSRAIPPEADSKTEFRAIVAAYLAVVPAALEERRVALALDGCNARFEAIETALQCYGGEFADRLRAASRARSVAEYEAAYAALVQIRNLTSELELRRTLLTKLATTAPAWADAIAKRLPPHDADTPPGDVVMAWRWRQLAYQLNERDNLSLEELEHSFETRVARLRAVTTDLADAKAWLAQSRRTQLAQRQALLGWLTMIKKIGKGTGKRVPILRKAAREAMDEAKTAVPVWIMPLIRVAENYDPRTTKFDVVIIDEASQSDVIGLVALYYGKQVVVVGDDEQVSPEPVGQNGDEVQHLIDAFLYGIPNAQTLDGRASLYDLAKQSFGGTISLREHFRCVPAIIAFSNNLSYHNSMIPLREASQSDLLPHVVAHRVIGSSDEKTNREEAHEILALVLACLELPEYEGKTFGVISMVGEDQARLIESLLLTHLEPAVLEKRRLLCGNSAQFQGDERDVIFLSVVDAPRNGPLSLRATPMFQKRFNVAASRARDQMWVVFSLDHATDLKPGDLRRRLIDHAINPYALATKIASQTAKADSDFERDVLRRLITAGYQAISQYRVGSYRIDILVQGVNCRLAVECDGEQYHTLLDLENDLARQSLLQRVGLTFHRIRGGKYYRDSDKEMARLVEHLDAMGIEPIGKAVPAEESGASQLRARVLARAAEIREELTAPRDYAAYRRETEHCAKAATSQTSSFAVSTNGSVETKAAQMPLVPPTTPHINDGLIVALIAHGFTPEAIIDKRTAQGGSLWVVADESYGAFFETLRSGGVRFHFSARGGKATDGRPGWYTRWAQ